MEHFPIRIGTLRDGDPIPFDVFVLVAEKHVHYFRGGESVDGTRLSSLRTKGVKKLFIQATDEPLYLRYLDEGLTRLQDRSVPIDKRAVAARDTVATAAENAPRAVETAAGYAITEKQVQKVVEFLTSETSAFTAMFKGTGAAADQIEHATNVVTLSLQLASKCGIRASKDLMELAMAALLHDLGRDPASERDSDTIDPKHPERALARLQNKPYVGANVLTLIRDHEECGNGAGYPGKKNLAKLPLSQQILNLCNDFDRTCSQKGLSPADALKTYYVDRIGSFELPLLQKLAEILR